MPPHSQRMVALVSQNAETLGHLRDYFESRSLKVRIHRRLSELTGEKNDPPDALILFPDEFSKGEVERRLSALLSALVAATVIVVTGDTQRFLMLRARLDDLAQGRLVVLPRPSFSWTLLEHVIRPSIVVQPAGDI